MEVGRSISKAITERLGGDMDSAMLHACNALDGTAKKMYPSLGVGARFKKLLRENYTGILEPMMPGINLAVIHRCHHGHGEPLPVGWELVPDTTSEPPRTSMNLSRPKGDWVVRLSDRSIYGMTAVGLLSSANVGQTLQDGLHLTWTSIASDIHVRLTNDWWGRAGDFAAITAMDRKRSRVTLDFGNVTPALTP